MAEDGLDYCCCLLAYSISLPVEPVSKKESPQYYSAIESPIDLEASELSPHKFIVHLVADCCALHTRVLMRLLIQC